MKKLSVFLVVAMLLSLCATAFAAQDLPDYSDMGKIVNLYNRTFPDDVSSFVSAPFNVVNGYIVPDGMQNGYNVLREGGTFKLSNVAKSDKYYLYVGLLPFYPRNDGTYSNCKDPELDDYFYGESYYYTVDGVFGEALGEAIDDDNVRKIRRGETIEFTLPEKVMLGDEEYTFGDDVMWVITVSTVHGTYVTPDYDGFSEQQFVPTVEDDYGWINYWFVKEDDAKVDEALTAAGISKRFIDVKVADYYNAPIEWAIEKEITNGTSANTFSPSSTCTQAQILTFLWRANGCPTAKSTPDWVDGNQYYAGAFAWAMENGVISGKLDPNAPCTRIDTVRYMYKLEKDAKADATLAESMTDVAAADKEIVAWAIEKGVTNGTSATTFSPSSTCTRGQIVTFLYRAYAK